MKNYEKPVLTESKIEVESVYAASGEPFDIEKGKCRFNQPFANKHSAVCQACCITGGVSGSVSHKTTVGDFTSCVEGRKTK